MTAFDPGQVTAAILAGGAGRRVGNRDKGLMMLDARELVAHAMASLHGQAGRIVICANRHASRYAKYAPVIADVQPGFRGPLAGIASALAACATPWLLTVPVDCPCAPTDLARRLHQAATSAGADLAVVFDGERVEPVFALYRASLAGSAADALCEGCAVWRWQERLQAARADFSDNRVAFANLNTPAEFRAWQETHRG